MQYPQPTIARAVRAVRCSPFQLPLFKAMALNSVSLQDVTGAAGVERHYTQQPLSEIVVETSLLWLIEVGVLRREVDGQGLTDSFRLTPLGRQLLNQEPQQVWDAASMGDRLQNTLNRWLRLPL